MKKCSNCKFEKNEPNESPCDHCLFTLGYDKYWIPKEERKADMTKDDLKTGMVVEHRNGEREVVMRGANHGDLFCDNPGFVRFDELKNDITHSDKDWDIVKVYEHDVKASMLSKTNDLRLVWQRAEPKKMTVAEVSAALGYGVEIVRG